MNEDAEEIVENLVTEHDTLMNRLAGNTKEAALHDIDRIRNLIDKLDNEIVRKLQARQRAVDIIHEIKEKWDIKIKDKTREDEIKMFLISEYSEMEKTIHVLYDHLFNTVGDN